MFPNCHVCKQPLSVNSRVPNPGERSTPDLRVIPKEPVLCRINHAEQLALGNHYLLVLDMDPEDFRCRECGAIYAQEDGTCPVCGVSDPSGEILAKRQEDATEELTEA